MINAFLDSCKVKEELRLTDNMKTLEHVTKVYDQVTLLLSICKDIEIKEVVSTVMLEVYIYFQEKLEKECARLVKYTF